MEEYLELIRNGNAGFVTALGMGGVFMALFFMYAYVSLLRKISNKKSKPKTQSTPLIPKNEVTSTAGEKMPNDNNNDRYLAAAIAVAYALEVEKHSILPVTVESNTNVSPWKMAGRLKLMKSL
jgi:Na+-transporting methylmalonyl-CoA/oxaloacetate decarboxylase gamma subunit